MNLTGSILALTANTCPVCLCFILHTWPHVPLPISWTLSKSSIVKSKLWSKHTQSFHYMINKVFLRTKHTFCKFIYTSLVKGNTNRFTANVIFTVETFTSFLFTTLNGCGKGHLSKYLQKNKILFPSLYSSPLSKYQLTRE